MNLPEVIISQYQACLEMLKQTITRCVKSDQKPIGLNEVSFFYLFCAILSICENWFYLHIDWTPVN
jgi:hypothetical protein